MAPVPSRALALGDELVRIHDSLRADLARLRTGDAEPGRPPAVHCSAFCETLTRHHAGEDAGAFPALAAQFPDLQPPVDKMAQDHVLIAGIAARVEELTAEPVEVRLTEELHEDVGFLPHLSLVAVDGDDIVGHVICTRAWVEPLGAAALALGPLGVLPAAQRRGVGTALVHGVLAVAEAADERLVALLGSPAYYRR